jgi:hypothetical protein
MNLKKIFYRLLFVLLLSQYICCYSEYSRENSIQDKTDAKEVTDRFYNAMKISDYKSIHSLFGEDYYKVSDTFRIDSILKMLSIKFGKLNSSELSIWHTKVVYGKESSGEYYLEYNNHYEKDSTREKFYLKKYDDSIKIASYTLVLNIPEFK